jgi:hypothetical protein
VGDCFGQTGSAAVSAEADQALMDGRLGWPAGSACCASWATWASFAAARDLSGESCMGRSSERESLRLRRSLESIYWTACEEGGKSGRASERAERAVIKKGLGSH